MKTLAQHNVTLVPAADWVTSMQLSLGRRSQRGVLMSHYTALGIGGPASLFGRASNEAELAQMITMARRHDVESLIIDDGLHLLIGDWGFEGFALRLEGDFNRLVPQAGGLSVGGACSVGRVLEACLAARFDAACLAPLQGQIGASLMRLDGAKRDALSCLIERLEFIDEKARLGSVSRLDELPTNVRTITRVHLRSAPVLDDASIGDRIEARRMFMLTRRPSHANPGPIFRLDDGSCAAAAIRKVGLAGLSMGQVAIPNRHADTLINLGGATACEVLDMVDCVGARLRGRLGLNLEPSLRIVGSF